MSYPIPNNEKKRLEALRLYEVLDTGPEQSFDDIAKIATDLTGMPIAVIGLIDDKRQWYKAKVGIEGTEAPREETFCTHTILGSDVMVVEDATADARFAQNPHVLAAGGVRFYAGAPIVDSEGHGLGALCVVDSTPRQMSVEKQASLLALARTTMRLLEQRRLNHQLAESLKEVRTVQGLLPICCSCKSIRTGEGFWLRLEEYFSTRTDARFSHGICPDCMRKEHPELYEELMAKKKAQAAAGVSSEAGR